MKKTREAICKMCAAFKGVGQKKKNYAVGGILILFAAFVVIKVTSGIVQWVAGFDVASLLSQTTDLKKDANGHTNIVLLGDGGHARDGADLVDTIIVAGIDFKEKSVSMLSIPRDFYVREEGVLKGKINELYRSNKNKLGQEGAYRLFRDVAGHITGMDIQYYFRVDFSAFVEAVDSLGGITVDVKEPIYDPYYPNETDDGYTLFKIDAGVQEMNGETALKFARSRKTTSDFDRAARQQQILMAIREKALSADALTDPKILKRLYNSVRNNINTNLTIAEILALGIFGKDFKRENLIAKVLHDDPTRDGGFLYTPERKYYNDQFVLVPDEGSLEQIHRYSDLIFNQREVYLEPARIEVLNASRLPGAAREKASVLKRYGFEVVDIENFIDRKGERKYIDKTFMRYNGWKVDRDGNVLPDFRNVLSALSAFVTGEAMPSEDPATARKADISIILGADFK